MRRSKPPGTRCWTPRLRPRPAPAARVAAKRAGEPATRPGKPKVRVVADDDDTEEIPRPQAKTKRLRPVEDEDRPRTKKPKRRTGPGRPADEKESSALAEWAGPAFLMLVG